MHSNRTVIHPDYAGLGLGIKLITESSKYVVKTYGNRVMAKFSSLPVYRAMIKDPKWKFQNIKRQIGQMKSGGSLGRSTKFHKGESSSNGGYRENVKTFHFEFVG